MSTILSFRSIENKHDVYRGKDCMKKFREPLIEHEEQEESYENVKICYICKENLKICICKIKNIIKLEIIFIKQGNIEVLGIAYVI